MSKWMYIVQAVLIASVLYTLVRRQPVVIRLQVVCWAVGVIGIWWRMGDTQLGFYSNDQMQYESIVRILVYETWPRTLEWWLDFSKIPYPLAALPLAYIGIHHTLALKTVSLICLMALTRDLLSREQDIRFSNQVRVLYFTGCGLIGIFFSLLALRETMMMFLVYRFATDKSPTTRLFAILALFLLRSHLAAALVVAEIALALWTKATARIRLGFAETPALIFAGVTLGTMMFSWRFANKQGLGGLDEVRSPFSDGWGSKEVTEIASNFVGLQFLTVHDAFIKLSVTELFGTRLVFSDTVLIPIGFTITCLVLCHKLNNRHRFTLLSFAIYVSIVTNTNFNSFRQNIPLMSLMGVVILDGLRSRTTPETSHNAGKRTISTVGGS